MKRKSKSDKFNKMLVGMLILGLSLLLYPSVANLWNRSHSARAINSFKDQVQVADSDENIAMWESTKAYNRDLLGRSNPYGLTDEMRSRYYENLKVTEDGMIGYIDIHKLGVELPIYHGTSDEVLRYAAGHIEWTSLPTGGKGTHCVLSGHRGLPSAKLFTDIDELREGDTFNLNILDKVLSYKVDQIRTVLPEELSNLMIDPEKDYCTLVTCTPYGINTHRLLVRGHRIKTTLYDSAVVSEAVLINPLLVAALIAAPILIILFMAVMLRKPDKKRKN